MFELDERLVADTVEMGRWPLCRVLLMNDANYPWLVLVPERAGAVEIHDLGTADRVQLIEEIATASQVLKQSFSADKINVGALGNVVRQLHVHVIARYDGDAAGRSPVWGRGAPKPYGRKALNERIGIIQKLMSTYFR